MWEIRVTGCSYTSKCSWILRQSVTKLLGATDTSNSECSVKCCTCNTSGIVSRRNIQDFNLCSNSQIVWKFGIDLSNITCPLCTLDKTWVSEFCRVSKSCTTWSKVLLNLSVTCADNIVRFLKNISIKRWSCKGC